MANPPAAVKLALESVCLMLNCETQDWKQIRAIMVKDSFISTIVNFDTMSITYGISYFYLLLLLISVASYSITYPLIVYGIHLCCASILNTTPIHNNLIHNHNIQKYQTIVYLPTWIHVRLFYTHRMCFVLLCRSF